MASIEECVVQPSEIWIIFAKNRGLENIIIFSILGLIHELGLELGLVGQALTLALSSWTLASTSAMGLRPHNTIMNN